MPGSIHLVLYRFFLGNLFLLLSLSSISQDSVRISAPRRSNRQSPAIGHFYGRIVDAKSGKGLEGVSVQLILTVFDTAKHSPRDSVVRGAITPTHGDFSFENLPIFGNYRIKLTAIGYSS